jgi:hypothetical protein
MGRAIFGDLRVAIQPKNWRSTKPAPARNLRLVESHALAKNETPESYFVPFPGVCAARLWLYWPGLRRRKR